MRADCAARREVGALLRSSEPGTDVSRWRVYSHTLLSDLGCSTADVDSVRTRLHEHNREGRLWSYAEPGTLEALHELKDMGFIVGIVSNSDGRVHRFLNDAGLGAMLDFVIDSGTVGVEKPDPRIFRIACDRAGVTPGEAVHVGDIYEIDVLGARAAGVDAVLVDPQDLHADVDTARIRAFTDLPAWLAGVGV